MAIVFGSPEAQEILARDKARIKAEQDLVANLGRMRAELESVQNEIMDIEAEMDDLQRSLSAAERSESKLLELIEKAEKLEIVIARISTTNT